MYYAGLALWCAFLIAAVFYSRRARHPDTRPVAAYLIFVIIFTVTSFGVFSALTLVLEALDRGSTLHNPVAAALFLAAVFIPAFLVARWQLQRPPRQRPPR